MASVVCLGILVADVIGRPIDSYPAPGTLQLVSSITPHLGGCAANTGIGLQTLGVPTRVVGKVGTDGFGSFVRDELASHGVNTAGLCEDPVTPTSATMVMVSTDAERTFLHCTGANATFTEADFSAEDVLAGTDLLHIAGHGLTPRFDGEQCARLLQHARARGVKTSLDTAGAPEPIWCENLRATLPHLDYFVPSLHEVRYLLPNPETATPEAVAEYLLNAGVRTVALKMGERGSYVTDGKEAHYVPSLRVEAVDATGAGDAFAAGFLAAALRGLDLKTCAAFGNAAGALCVTQVGTTAGYRSFEDTGAFLSQQFDSDSLRNLLHS